jgi:hypothetical protein
VKSWSWQAGEKRKRIFRLPWMAVDNYPLPRSMQPTTDSSMGPHRKLCIIFAVDECGCFPGKQERAGVWQPHATGGWWGASSKFAARRGSTYEACSDAACHTHHKPGCVTLAGARWLDVCEFWWTARPGLYCVIEGTGIVPADRRAQCPCGKCGCLTHEAISSRVSAGRLVSRIVCQLPGGTLCERGSRPHST